MKITSAEFVKGIVGTNDIMTDGTPEVAFIGRSNVGKSSVINSLVQRKGLVSSSSRPGKTTEINFFRVNDAVYFVDLPGYGYAKLSQRLREKLRKMILWYFLDAEVSARKTVLIIDAKVGLTEFDSQMLYTLQEAGEEVIVIANKFDKIKKSDVFKRRKELQAELGKETIFIPYSATAKLGREELLAQIFVEK